MIPVTRIVFPFFTQVIVFLLLLGVADGEGLTIAAVDALADGVGDAVAVTTGSGFGNNS